MLTKCYYQVGGLSSKASVAVLAEIISLTIVTLLTFYLSLWLNKLLLDNFEWQTEQLTILFSAQRIFASSVNKIPHLSSSSSLRHSSGSFWFPFDLLFYLYKFFRALTQPPVCHWKEYKVRRRWRQGVDALHWFDLCLPTGGAHHHHQHRIPSKHRCLIKHFFLLWLITPMILINTSSPPKIFSRFLANKNVCMCMTSIGWVLIA